MLRLAFLYIILSCLGGCGFSILCLLTAKCCLKIRKPEQRGRKRCIQGHGCFHEWLLLYHMQILFFLSDTCSQRVRVKKCLTFSLSWGRVLSIVLFSCTQIYLLLNTAHQKSICEAQYFSYTCVLLVFFCHWYLVSLETSMSSAIRMLWLKITHKLFPGVLFFFVCYYLYGQQCYFTGDNICFICHLFSFHVLVSQHQFLSWSSCDTLYLFLLSSSSRSPPLCRSVCLCKPHLLFQGRIFLFFLPCSPAYLW